VPWVKVDDKLHDNDKLGAVSDPAFRLWVLALSWSNDKLTDGHVPASRPVKLLALRNEKKTIAELIEAKLWHRASSPCRACVEQRDEKKGDAIPSGGYVIHDYFEYQRAAWVIREDRQTKSRAGRTGAEARWGANGTSHSTPHGTADSTADSTPHSSVPMAKGGSRIAGANAKGGSSHAPVPPYPRTPRSDSYGDEPAIPDVPERSNDRGGTTKGGGLHHIGTSARRAAR
jgi:hypothetical protein